MQSRSHKRLNNTFNTQARRKATSTPRITKPPRLIAHRGGAATAPENTLAAIRQAAKNGADGVEIDVRVTSDGIPVLMHDASLKRTTNGRGKVTNTTLAEIKKLDAGSWHGAAFKGEKIPTLAETMRLCARLDLDVVIDIKPARGREATDTKRILNHAYKAWPRNKPPPELNSESVSVLNTAKNIRPEWPRSIVFRRPFLSWQSRLNAATGLSAGIRIMGTGWVGAIARLAKRHNKSLSVWTVNKPEEALKLARIGVDTIFTDRPDALRRALRRDLPQRHKSKRPNPAP